MPAETATAALAVILDPATHPILIHCNEGEQNKTPPDDYSWDHPLLYLTSKSKNELR